MVLFIYYYYFYLLHRKTDKKSSDKGSIVKDEPSPPEIKKKGKKSERPSSDISLDPYGVYNNPYNDGFRTGYVTSLKVGPNGALYAYGDPTYPVGSQEGPSLHRQASNTSGQSADSSLKMKVIGWFGSFGEM